MPLLSLPTEVRLSIFELAMPRGEVYEYNSFFTQDAGEYPTPTKQTTDYPALLTVSKEVRAEAASVFFKNNIMKVFCTRSQTNLTCVPARIQSQANFTESSYKYMKNFSVNVETYGEFKGVSTAGRILACDESQIKFAASLSNNVVRGLASEESFHSLEDDCVECCSKESEELLGHFRAEMCDALKVVLEGTSRKVVVEEWL